MEIMMIDTKAIEEHIRGILVALGDDPEREGLKDTPKRVAKMYEEVFLGMNYSNHEIAQMFDKTFEDGIEELDTSKVVAEKGMHLDQTGDLIRTAAELKPEVLFLALGLNDISGTDGDTDAFIEKYKAVLANVREQMPDAVLYINCVLPVSAQKEEEEPVYAKIPDYNTALKAMCDEEGITFIDNTEIVKDEYYEQDGEHMKAEYYPIWAEHMAEVAGI